MARTLSLTVPSGHLTLGNLLGAIRYWAEDQRGDGSLYGVADLHALTTEHDPATVRALTCEQLALLVAAGLNPRRCTIFVQSQVPAHAKLRGRRGSHRGARSAATALRGHLRRSCSGHGDRARRISQGAASRRAHARTRPDGYRPAVAVRSGLGGLAPGRRLAPPPGVGLHSSPPWLSAGLLARTGDTWWRDTTGDVRPLEGRLDAA